MKLSVVLVSYNTRYFIDLCIHSVLKSMDSIIGEVIVVDNNSTDNSVSFIQAQYPSVKLIVNKDNVGFGKANNQGISIATGEYVLLLNPDTIVPEDCFEKCIAYLDKHPDKGALGVKMLDGAGRYLPESKRGLPTPQTAFYKMSGLHKLFPKSPTISHYYHGNIATNNTGDVDVLTGAFFMARKPIGDACGWFDEAYFMYGEDIDLSYSFTQSGNPIVYFPETSIIHFKGESSKDVDKKYINSFFGAMQIFYTKHFQAKYSKLFRYLVLGGIYAKANAVRFSQLFTHSKNQKQHKKDRNFVVWAKSDEIKQACSTLIGQNIASISTIEELQSIIQNSAKEISLVFTFDISTKNQIDVMQKVVSKNVMVEFFFLSYDNSFILGSPSKKASGLVIKHN